MPLLSAMSPDEPLLAGIHGRMVGLWRDAGLGSADAERAQRALQCYLSGSSQWHQSSCTGSSATPTSCSGWTCCWMGSGPGSRCAPTGSQA